MVNLQDSGARTQLFERINRGNDLSIAQHRQLNGISQRKIVCRSAQAACEPGGLVEMASSVCSNAKTKPARLLMTVFSSPEVRLSMNSSPGSTLPRCRHGCVSCVVINNERRADPTFEICWVSSPAQLPSALSPSESAPVAVADAADDRLTNHSMTTASGTPA